MPPFLLSPLFSHSFFFLFLLLILISLPTTHATNFSISIDQSISQQSYLLISPNIADVVFGLSPSGHFRALLSVSISPSSSFSDQDPNTPECSPALVICQASPSFVRAPSFERRHPSETAPQVYDNLSILQCDPNKRVERLGPCQDQHLDLNNHPSPYHFKAGPNHDQLQPNQLYIAAIVACDCAFTNGADTKLTVSGTAEWLNPANTFPHLGWEEAVFPPLAEAAFILFAAQSLILLLFALIAPLTRLKLPLALLLSVAAAAALKALHAGLTFLYFRRVAQTGIRQRWYLYTRLAVVAFADVAFVCVAMAIASGYRILPADWFVDGRAPVFSVYIGITLQILIIIAVKLMFPFRYLGVLTYTLAAGLIALAMCLASYRNYHFLRRYTILIERAHIYIKTTPIPRMQRVYLVNIAITAIVYVFKIVSVGLWDYGIKRPDALWGSLEIADAILLLWYTFALFPRKSSALYVDLSNISNERLHQAEAWRASQAEHQTAESNLQTGTHLVRESENTERDGSTRAGSTSDPDNVDHVQAAVEEGRIEASSPEPPANPQPPWVEWQSGMSLPRPDSSTWGVYSQVTRLLRRERRLVPVLPSSIVLGSPSDSPDTLKLNVGTPTTGPRSVPRAFDEKGAEIAYSSFRRPVQVDASSSVGAVTVAALDEANSGQESGSERRLLLRSILQRFRRSNRTSRTAPNSEHGAQSIGIESTVLEPLDARSVNLPQHESSQMAPSVASSNASCDGILLVQEDG